MESMKRIQPHRLVVRSSKGDTSFDLDAPQMTIGRGADSDISIDLDVVSSTHARLFREGSTYRFVQVGETNPTLLYGAPIESRLLQDGDRLEIAPGNRHAVVLIFEASNTQAGEVELELTRVPKVPGSKALKDRPTPKSTRVVLPVDGTVLIGRSPAADLVLPSLSVSRRHARIGVHDGVVRLSDDGSANGTYVNGVAVQSRALMPGDIVRVGPYKLSYHAGALELWDDSRSVRLDVHRVSKVVGGKTLLDEVSFSAQPGEILAIAGTSGAGKSTLIDALNGTRPPTSGNVLVNGADLYVAYDALRPLFGYVPQETTLPSTLTVRRALDYVAQLRLPPDVSRRDASDRVDDVMRVLDLSERADVQIDRLSGGQQKRASIAAELIARPGLFFLDEPTSGLDPGLTRRVTTIIRELANGGATIILISHDVESLQAADRIVFLGGGGRVVFVGSPTEALSYFGVVDFAEIYARVESDDSAAWRARLHASDHYRDHVAPTLVRADMPSGGEEQAVSWDPIALISSGGRRGASASRQFLITARRYLESMLRDRRNLALLLLQAPIIALILIFVENPTDFQGPPQAAIDKAREFGVSPAQLASTLPLILAATATWFGAINSAREIVKELPMLRRERLAGLRLLPYLASKFVVIALLCLFQTAALLVIIDLKVKLPSSGALMWGPLELWITLSLAAFAAVGLGLLISASVSNADRAQSLVPIVLIPQLIFVGGAGTGTVSSWLSYITITHWGVKAMDISARIPYNHAGTGFGALPLVECWIVLVGMTMTFTSAAAFRMSRLEAS